MEAYIDLNFEINRLLSVLFRNFYISPRFDEQHMHGHMKNIKYLH
jgi:hypothetical protein